MKAQFKTAHAAGSIEAAQDSSGWLVTELDAIEEHPRGWNSSRATALLAVATRKLGAIARKNNRPAGEVAGFAWEHWQTGEAQRSGDAWANTALVVGRRMAGAGQAQRKGCDESRLRHVDVIEFEGFVEVQETDVVEELGTTPEMTFDSLAMATARQLIMEHGHSKFVAGAALKALLTLGATASSPKGAVDTATRESAVPAALGIDKADWGVLVRLLFGNATGTSVGLFEAELDGLAFGPTVLNDRKLGGYAALKNIRNATTAFGRAAA